MEKHVDQMTKTELQRAFVERTHEDQFREASGIGEKRAARLDPHIPVWYGFEQLIGYEE